MAPDPHALALPDGLTSRPLTVADTRAVYEVMAAQQQHDIGSVEIEEADIVGDWQRPSFDVAASTVGVFDGERLVAYGEVTDPWRADAAVHPDYRGRGLGTAVAAWIRDLARSRGSEIIGMPNPQGSAGDRLLEELGYFVRWESWVLQLAPGREIAAQPLPQGYSIRTATTPDDHRAAHDVIEDAFLEWAERDRQPFEDFAATSLQRPGFEPWNLRIAVDGTGSAVGACFVVLADDVAYVDSLAVRKDRRGLGLARALLADAFGNAREHGATRSELSTDSRTGALGLYERVGMVVSSTWVHRAIRL
jgi:GNAT superfamily N-acetyltransferase